MTRTKVKIGDNFARLTVIEEAPSKGGKSRWICQCECGTVTGPKYGFQLTNGQTTSCGCAKIERCKSLAKRANEASVKSRKQNLIGNTYGRLTVIDRAPNKGDSTMYQCRCECGTIKEIAHTSLKNGLTRSCGCLLKERSSERFKIHGCSAPCSDPSISPEAKRTYRIWKGLRQRCTNPNYKQWENYGGRGISYDPRWDDFQTFLEDMGIAPHDRSIDRIDPDGSYCKENCRWATHTEQNNNQRRHRRQE